MNRGGPWLSTSVERTLRTPRPKAVLWAIRVQERHRVVSSPRVECHSTRSTAKYAVTLVFSQALLGLGILSFWWVLVINGREHSCFAAKFELLLFLLGNYKTGLD